jgi:hypothetical protein
LEGGVKRAFGRGGSLFDQIGEDRCHS